MNKEILLVTSKIISSVEMTFRYTDDSTATSVVSEGDIVIFEYVSEAKLYNKVGRIAKITTQAARGFGNDSKSVCTLTIDCSVEHKSDIINVETVNIRSISKQVIE